MKFSIGSSSRGPARRMEISQELSVLREAEKFRRLAALAWDKETIYPKSEYIIGSSSGQCGVTNFGFGLWLCRLGLASPDQMAFEEGKIVSAAASPVGDNHTWLRVDDINDGYAHPDLSVRFDLAGDQFPGIDVPVIVQYDDYFFADPHRSCDDRVYRADKVICFSDYDINRFTGRLDYFMRKVRDIAGPEAPAC